MCVFLCDCVPVKSHPDICCVFYSSLPLIRPLFLQLVLRTQTGRKERTAKKLVMTKASQNVRVGSDRSEHYTKKRYHSEIFNDVQEIVDCHDFFRYLFLINTTAFPSTTVRRMSPRYGTLCEGLEVLGFRRKQQLADRKSAKDRAEPWMANRGRLRQEPIYYRAESVALLILHTRSVPGTHRPLFLNFI